jgi:hypothetical protein
MPVIPVLCSLSQEDHVCEARLGFLARLCPKKKKKRKKERKKEKEWRKKEGLKCSPNLARNTSLQVDKAEKTSNEININNPTLRHITVKCLKTKEKQNKIWKIARKKQHCMYGRKHF